MADSFAAVRPGEIVHGTVTEVTRSGAGVALDGHAGAPAGFIGSLDLSWRGAEPPQRGDRIRAQVIAIDRDRRRVLLSLAATENPGLWAFLQALRPGQRLSGTVAAVERFGVFVMLDDGPPHPALPGVGFITMPELSWHRFDDPAEVVTEGQRVECEFLLADTSNGEARLSLRATQHDPFQRFATTAQRGQSLAGRVTKLTTFGAFVRVRDDIEGLVPQRDPSVRVGDEVVVTVVEIDPVGRRLVLSLCP